MGKVLVIKDANFSSVALSHIVPFVANPKITISSAGIVSIKGNVGTTIYYTTDGQEPTTASSRYNEEFSVSENTTVKAIAVYGEKISGVSTKAYITAKIAITVIASPEGGGTVAGSGEYDYESIVEISATPSKGYRFVQWSDGETNETRQITVGPEATTYTAEFEAIPSNWRNGIVFNLPASETAEYTVTDRANFKFYKTILFGRKSITVSWKADDPIHVVLVTWNQYRVEGQTSSANYGTDAASGAIINTTVENGIRSFTFNSSSLKAVEIAIAAFDYETKKETVEDMSTVDYDEFAITVESTT